MVAKPDNSRNKNQLMLISTIVVSVVLLGIVLAAALSPPGPERVVSEVLDSFVQQNDEALNNNLTDSYARLLQDAQGNMLWTRFWENGEELFADYRLGETRISGDEAQILVYYGPGFIQELEFTLRRDGRRWKVTGLEDE